MPSTWLVVVVSLGVWGCGGGGPSSGAGWTKVYQPTSLVVGGALASVAAASERPVDHAPFEWVGLVNRSRAAEARLEVRPGPVKTPLFASVTDLTTGKEWPVPFTREGDVITVVVRQCPARRLLRLYWPLER